MRKFLSKRLLPILGCLILCMSMITPAMAVDTPYTPVSGTSMQFQKALVMKSQANVPTITFEYSIEPGAAVASQTPGKMEIISPSVAKGVQGVPTVNSASFAPGHATVTSADGVTIESGKKAALENLTVDFSGVSFSEPGIYRYILKETSAGQQGILYDTQAQNASAASFVSKARILDVYVTDNAGSLQVSAYVLHELPNDVATTDELGSQHDPARLADKSIGYVNEYETVDLTMSKTVAGNQGSRDKYFQFNIAITNAGPNVALNVVWSDAVDALNAVKSPATIYEANAMHTANGADDNLDIDNYQWVTDANGAVTKTVYLKHGQQITIQGLAKGAKYTITEVPEDYKPSTLKDVGDGTSPAAGTSAAVAEATGMAKDHSVAYTNPRNGIVPTGIAMSLIPGIALIGGAGAGIFAMARKKKEDEEE